MSRRRYFLFTPVLLDVTMFRGHFYKERKEKEEIDRIENIETLG